MIDWLLLIICVTVALLGNLLHLTLKEIVIDYLVVGIIWSILKNIKRD
ncbi:TPA: hypothetical protein ACG6RF_001990 [Streptococcus agalactiae]|nr:hypothetical protein [Streptococcus agalactiae]HEO7770456.1 hypothetical protein [Streptococcus agalactiae]